MGTAPSFSAAGRRLAVSPADATRVGLLAPDRPMPIVIQPVQRGVRPVQWACANAALIEQQLDRAGAVLFRGFDIGAVETFRAFVAAVAPTLMDYREGAAPRKQAMANVYSSTEFPPAYPIPMHHELAYAHQWPMKIWFYCDTPAPSGGATPIADDRLVLPEIDPAIRRRFEQQGVLYVRNYGPALDVPWQEAFQTTDRAEVNRYCQGAGLECHWRDDRHVQTRRLTPALRRHPKTGQELWFNHAHLFHISNVEAELRDQLIARLDPADYPRNAYYGDGSPIEDAALDAIRAAYDRAALRFDWQRGDVLAVDNMAVTHGREPFTGPRRILVAMTDPVFARDFA